MRGASSDEQADRRETIAVEGSGGALGVTCGSQGSLASRKPQWRERSPGTAMADSRSRCGPWQIMASSQDQVDIRGRWR